MTKKLKNIIVCGVFIAIGVAVAFFARIWIAAHTGVALHQPPEIKSTNGVLTATLEAKEQKIRLNDVMVDGTVYNGEYAGPVLRVHPGDTMKIKLINHASRPMNIHYHGLETSPLDNHDNIHVSVKPGETFDYEVYIPEFQPPGLYWYHDHTHGISQRNVMEGLSGLLIVEGFAEQFPKLAGIKEQLLVLKDYEFYDSKDPVIGGYYHNNIQSINGQTFSKITMRPGETQLWRLSNQSSNLYFHLSMKDHKFRIIGVDGRSTLKETETDVLNIPPAVRMEVLVDGGNPGIYDLVSEKILTGSDDKRSLNRVLGRVEVSGEPGHTVSMINGFPDDKDLRKAKINESRTITFSQLNDDKNYFVNGRRFDAKRIDMRIPLGNTEEWTIKNDSDDMHVFHIHQVSFQITEYDGKPKDFDGYVDNVRVPERSSVKIIIPFTNPLIVGSFVVHCHVLKHEDNGMMSHIEVYDPNPDGAFPFYKTGRNICRAPEPQPVTSTPSP